MGESEVDELEECILSDGGGQHDEASSPLVRGRSRTSSSGGQSQDGVDGQSGQPGPNQEHEDTNYSPPSYHEYANAAEDVNVDGSSMTSDTAGNKPKSFRSIRKVRKPLPTPTPTTAPNAHTNINWCLDPWPNLIHLTTSPPHHLTNLGVFKGHRSVGRPLQEEHVASAAGGHVWYERHRKQKDVGTA
jgi:hypothetical protein